MESALTRGELASTKLDTTAAAVAAAAYERKRAKTSLFYLVLRLGTSLIVVGLVAYIISSLVTKGISLQDRVISNTVRAIAGFFTALGILVVSTIPLDQFDMDAFLNTNKITRRILVFILFAERLAVGFPNFKIVNVGDTICCCVGSLGMLMFAFCSEVLGPTTSPRLTTCIVVFYIAVGTLAAKGFAFVEAALCCRHGNSSGAYWHGSCGFRKTIVLPAEPSNEAVFVFVAGLLVASGFLLVAVFWRQRAATSTMGCIGHQRPTLAFYVSLYVFYFVNGVNVITMGGAMVQLGDTGGCPLIIEGSCQLLPAVLIALVGRRRIFGIMSRYFDRSRAQVDGAVMAGLLDRMPLEVGMFWWVHRDSEAATQFPNKLDPRRHWQRGTIVMIQEGEITVRLELERAVRRRQSGQRFPFVRAWSNGYEGRRETFPDGVPPDLPARLSRQQHTGPRMVNAEGPLRVVPAPISATSGSDTHEDARILLRKAKESLRCLVGEHLTFALMASSSQDSASREAAALVQPLAPKEQIDFFISHSWHDPPDHKWAQLEEHRRKFKERTGRMPTYWLDKVCIDQDNITDGLRVLIINIMACRKILVVCGKTYTSRLWCMLELFAVFSFVDDHEAALQRVEILPIEQDGVTQDLLLTSLVNFELSHAHCYDPNEETRLRGVMKAVGEEKFVSRIRLLGNRLMKRGRRRSDGVRSRNSPRAVSGKKRSSTRGASVASVAPLPASET